MTGVTSVNETSPTDDGEDTTGLTIEVSSEDGERVISVSGELERSTMLELIGACTSRLDESIVIDLGGLTFLDGGGYSSLVVIRETANARDRTVTVRNVRGQPARLMKLFADLEGAQAIAERNDREPASAALDASVDEEIERRYSDLLAEFARSTTDFSIPAILDHLVERIVEVLPIDAAGVTLITSGSDGPHVSASDESALAGERLQNEFGDGPRPAADADASAVSVPDLRADDRFSGFTRRAIAEGIGTIFSFPLRHEDRRLGTMDLYRERPGALGARQLTVAQTFADVAAAYIVNAQGRADLVASTQHATHLALHDPLTGLPNRALMFERLVNALDRCRRSRALVGVLYIDLDNFKGINDTFGHRIGDEVLTIVAQRLTALLRPGDTVARLGGDEFAVLCDDIADPSHLEPIADRVIDSFDLPFDVSTGPVEVHASVGISIGNWTSPEQILERADTAMYQAKRRGGGHAVFDRTPARASDHPT
jgi:diguanylate cyclase (GGDEF)-like protein